LLGRGTPPPRAVAIASVSPCPSRLQKPNAIRGPGSHRSRRDAARAAHGLLPHDTCGSPKPHQGRTLRCLELVFDGQPLCLLRLCEWRFTGAVRQVLIVVAASSHSGESSQMIGGGFAYGSSFRVIRPFAFGGPSSVLGDHVQRPALERGFDHTAFCGGRRCG